MGETIRFGVSLDSDLLERFDELCTERDYSNRSEAIRDLIRGALVENEWENAEGASAATLTLIYDHHKSDLAKKLMSIQHDAHHLIITTLHVHLDHDNCLEVLVLKGPGAEIQALAQRLISTKGVVFGRLSQATDGRILR
jgi:CopG family nickel-responsive transcriptional regulator